MKDDIQVIITEAAIRQRIAEMAADILQDCGGQPITAVIALKGAVFFAVDLLRKLDAVRLEMDFTDVSFYGEGTVVSEQREQHTAFHVPLAGKNVLLIDDIFDTGTTLSFLWEKIKRQHPRDIKICVLLNKEGVKKKKIRADYIGFHIPNEFVVGYGLDYAQQYRHLPYIGILKNAGQEGIC